MFDIGAGTLERQGLSRGGEAEASVSGVFPRWIACSFCDAQMRIPHPGDHTCCCGMRTHVSGPRDMLAAAERLVDMGIESPESILPLRQAAEREEASVSDDDAYMEDDERKRYDRYKAEKARIMAMDPETARAVLAETVGAIYGALADYGSVSPNLHPADVVSKHLQRGNIDKDGNW
ncbi:MAG: hypothetical protein ACPGVG_18950 [Mycobacterium sp.]